MMESAAKVGSRKGVMRRSVNYLRRPSTSMRQVNQRNTAWTDLKTALDCVRLFEVRLKLVVGTR